MTHLRVAVDDAYGESEVLIRGTLRCLLEIAGWQSEYVAEPHAADVLYSPAQTRPVSAAKRACHILGMPAHRWNALRTSTPQRVDGITVPSGAVGGREGDWDPVALAAFFLAGMHERDPAIRNEPGPHPMPASGIAVWGIDKIPSVHVAATRIAAAICAAMPGLRPAPRWPRGKHWAVVLTHDFDRFHRYRPGDFARSAGAAFGEGKIGQGLRQLGKAVISVGGRLTRVDPYAQSLDEWVRLQDRLGLRSAIYVAAVAKSDPVRDPLDVTYDITSHRIGTMLRSLSRDGWEIGLHSSIRAWKDTLHFQGQRNRLEDVIGAPVIGNRAHYWSINQDDTLESLVRLQEAGFLYDSSLGMNTVHGHRRGVNYPYRPFALEREALEGLWELPPTMMDQSLWAAADTEEGWRQALSSRLEETRKHEGMLVFDWHTDSLVAGYMGNSTRVVVDAISVLRADVGCWMATPREIVEWCRAGRWVAQ